MKKLAYKSLIFLIMRNLLQRTVPFGVKATERQGDNAFASRFKFNEYHSKKITKGTIFISTHHTNSILKDFSFSLPKGITIFPADG
jgi:hypothetical protein